MFDTLDQCGVGGRIGNIRVAAPGCCDDVAVQSNEPSDLQILVNISKHNCGLHHYILQPQKSVAVEPELTKQKEKPVSKPLVWKLGEESMQITKKHLIWGYAEAPVLRKLKKKPLNRTFQNLNGQHTVYFRSGFMVKIDWILKPAYT